MKYYFCLNHEYQITVPSPLMEGVVVNQENGQVLATLELSGLLTVYSGYAWDGCSPRYNVLDLFWVGTPNGVNSEENNNKPLMYYPSLVHDVLLQMYDGGTLIYPSKKEIHSIFKDCGKDFRFINLYYTAIKLYHQLFQ